jgi:hypothetical protein
MTRRGAKANSANHKIPDAEMSSVDQTPDKLTQCEKEKFSLIFGSKPFRMSKEIRWTGVGDRTGVQMRWNGGGRGGTTSAGLKPNHCADTFRKFLNCRQNPVSAGQSPFLAKSKP